MCVLVYMSVCVLVYMSVCVCVGLGVGVCTRVWHLYVICNVCTSVYGIQRSKPSTCAFTDQFEYM